MVDIPNKNFLSPLNFKFQMKRAPYVDFFLQSVRLPSLSLPVVDTPTPLIRFPLAGDHLMYDELRITFKVHEDLQNYLEIHNWLRGEGKLDTSEYSTLARNPIVSGMGLKSDISVTILTSNKNPNYEFIFHDAFPTSISGMDFSSMNDDINYIEASASFRFTYYDINKIT